MHNVNHLKLPSHIPDSQSLLAWPHQGLFQGLNKCKRANVINSCQLFELNAIGLICSVTVLIQLCLTLVRLWVALTPIKVMLGF